MSMSAAQARRQAVAQALEEAVGPVSAAAWPARLTLTCDNSPFLLPVYQFTLHL